MFKLLKIVSISAVAYSFQLQNPSSGHWKRRHPGATCTELRAVGVDKPSTPSTALETSNFLNFDLASEIRSKFKTPVFVYDENTLRAQAQKALNFPNPYDPLGPVTVRFAMKACPNAAVLKLFYSMGLNFDASSGYECERAMKAGIKAQAISLSSQELPENFKELIEKGIEFNACSLNQLETFGKLFPGGKCGVRFNPGKGSGGTGKTNVGGPSSSFGIWFELLPDVKAIVSKYNLEVTRIHTHIGSGSDPAIWQEVSTKSLSLVGEFPTVTTLNLGGGFKVGRMSYEQAGATNLEKVGLPIIEAFKKFEMQNSRRLKLEIEPGTFLTANSGALLTTVRDIVTTGKDGHTFLKLDAGMTEVLRPSLYGAQHPIVALKSSTSSQETDSYIIVGHCCESGDLFSCAPGDPEGLQERHLLKVAIGDLVTIEGAGAYCAGMSTKNYNSFPEAPEVLVDMDGKPHLIRKRQTLDQIFANEVEYKPKI